MRRERDQSTDQRCWTSGSALRGARDRLDITFADGDDFHDRPSLSGPDPLHDRLSLARHRRLSVRSRVKSAHSRRSVRPRIDVGDGPERRLCAPRHGLLRLTSCCVRCGLGGLGRLAVADARRRCGRRPLWSAESSVMNERRACRRCDRSAGGVRPAGLGRSRRRLACARACGCGGATDRCCRRRRRRGGRTR